MKKKELESKVRELENRLNRIETPVDNYVSRYDKIIKEKIRKLKIENDMALKALVTKETVTDIFKKFGLIVSKYVSEDNIKKITEEIEGLTKDFE